MLGFRLNKLGAAMRGNKPIVALRFDDPTRALDSRITFSRASSATYFNSAGVLQTAGSGVARAHAFQDYNPSTLAPLGFLIEEQRTNLLLQSADFGTSWGTSSTTVTTNSTTSPDGGTNADTIAHTASGGAINQTTQAFTASSTVTFSVFAKKNASNFVRFEIGNLVNCWFDLNTGATATNSAGSGNVLFSSKSIQAINNGWYRCVVAVTTTTVTTLGCLLFATNTDNNTSSNGSSVYLWGAQAEVGAFATSYIATTAAAATRLADSALITGANFSGFFNASAGTLTVQHRSIGTPSNCNLYQVRRDGTGADEITLRYGSALGGSPGSVDMYVRAGSVTQMDSGGSVIALGTLYKTAFTHAANDCALVTNGGAAQTDTSVTLPTGIAEMIIGGTGFCGHIPQVSYFRARLSNATLQSLTS
jgi:hypothetical protein